MHALTRISLALVLCAGFAAADDQADAILNAMKASPSPYVVSLPPGAKVGLWWEHSMQQGTKLRYGITGERDGKLIVEQEQDVAGVLLVNAWLVDPSVDLMAEVKDGERVRFNVLEAWIGIKGEVPQAKKVMQAPLKTPAETIEGVEVKESDTSIELAGRTWEAHVYETDQSSSTVVKGTNFLLKSIYQGKVVVELTGFGDGAKSGLVWQTKK